ncbi:MAG: asparagine synthase (glutamine-hydrolyzing) [Planctomycetaceae bacterium]|nr:asparagine synthase (glutamine-hydrolyzing) [Planctomycetaceae bacterium]
MCGISGQATTRGRRLSQDPASVAERLRLLAHRGPDGDGLVHGGHVALGHTRLALLDPEGGAQPFTLSDGRAPRVVLAWNGEIYNHLALRAELARAGAVFRTRSDTETLAHMLARHGTRAIERLRGMFAIAAWFPDEDRLILARDPFGTIPLFHATVGAGDAEEVLFASEPAPILAHPAMRLEPDWASVASYLEMPRRSFGDRTLYRGLHALRPGEIRTYDLSGDRLACGVRIAEPARDEPRGIALHDAAWQVRDALIDSIEQHLVADAPVCSLLSGGIDSTIVASVARVRSARLVTFAAGADEDARRPGTDLFTARRVAELLRSEHHEVRIDGGQFESRWDELLGAGLMPLATPNEIAISLLADGIRGHAKAALSGEGADELFGGYGPPLEATLAWIDADIDHSPESAARFYRTAFGWTPRNVVPELLAGGAPDDDPLGTLLEASYADAGDTRSLDAHLRVQQRVNLVNLLERLNLSLMRGSVEGRVPFCDRAVARAASAAGASHNLVEPRGGGTAVATRTVTTKRVLRTAFADVLTPEILDRPKASFPLPFERWIAARAEWIDGPVSSEVFSPAARELVRTQAAQHWRLAWPMLNLARWLDSVFA